MWQILIKVLLNFRRNDSVYKRRSNRKDSNLEFKVHEKRNI